MSATENEQNLNLDDTILITRGRVFSALKYIGNVGTGNVPFNQVAELVSTLQDSVKAPKVESSTE